MRSLSDDTKKTVNSKIMHKLSVNCGAGGIRTLVQTRKQSAFYMLSFILIVGKERD
jgi:hypothetical protein